MKKYLVGINEKTLEYKIETIEDIHNEFKDKEITYEYGYTFITCVDKRDIRHYKKILIKHMLKETYKELIDAQNELNRLNKLYFGLVNLAI